MKRVCVWPALLILGVIPFTKAIEASNVRTGLSFPKGYMDLALEAAGSFDLGLLSPFGPVLSLEESFSWKEGILLYILSGSIVFEYTPFCLWKFCPYISAGPGIHLLYTMTFAHPVFGDVTNLDIEAKFHLLTGIDLTVTRRFSFFVEARATAPLKTRFTMFDRVCGGMKLNW